MRDLTIGSRGSQLALWQSEHISSLLKSAYPDIPIKIEIIKTLGDKDLDAPLSKVGDKGLFTKELERALLDEKIDLAVHSLKDLPTSLPPGCRIGAITHREDPHDVFVGHPRLTYGTLEELPPGTTIATGSLRRTSQLLAFRQDLTVTDIRGNLNTRLHKLDGSSWGGMLLAHAGVKRLGWNDRITQVIPFDVMLPAVGQGSLGIEIREGDSSLQASLAVVHDPASAAAAQAERAFLRLLEGGCQIPIGTYAAPSNEEIHLDAFIGSLDGRRTVRSSASGPIQDPESLGTSLAEEMLDNGGREILDEIRLEEEGRSASS